MIQYRGTENCTVSAETFDPQNATWSRGQAVDQTTSDCKHRNGLPSGAGMCSGAAHSSSMLWPEAASFPKESHAPGIPAEFLKLRNFSNGTKLLMICLIVSAWWSLLELLGTSWICFWIDQRWSTPLWDRHFKDTSCLALLATRVASVLESVPRIGAVLCGDRRLWRHIFGPGDSLVIIDQVMIMHRCE